MNQINMNAEGVSDREVLDMVAEAIRKTDEKYYSYNNIMLYERIFCYEFYHQFRLLQESKMRNVLEDERRIWESLILSGEPWKNIAIPLKDVLEAEKKKRLTHPSGDKPPKEYKEPDFVLHGGLCNINPDLQIVAIEVKKKESDNINLWVADLAKLSKMRSLEKLHFRMGIFIVVGMTNEEMKENLNGHELDFDLSNIYLIGTESLRSNPFFQLDSICSNPKKNESNNQ